MNDKVFSPHFNDVILQRLVLKILKGADLFRMRVFLRQLGWYLRRGQEGKSFLNNSRWATTNFEAFYKEVSNELLGVRFKDKIYNKAGEEVEKTADLCYWLSDEDKERAEQAETAVSVAVKYDELLMAVGIKVYGETRHETALRYIKDTETGDSKNYRQYRKRVEAELDEIIKQIEAEIETTTGPNFGKKGCLVRLQKLKGLLPEFTFLMGKEEGK